MTISKYPLAINSKIAGAETQMHHYYKEKGLREKRMVKAQFINF